MVSTMNDATRLVNVATGNGSFPSAAGMRLFTPQKTFTFMKTVVGVFTTLVVTLEGSLDGINWYTLGSDNTLVNGATFVVDKPSLYVRATLSTFAGGTSVTVDMVCMDQ
jgi:hypothetical protein